MACLGELMVFGVAVFVLVRFYGSYVIPNRMPEDPVPLIVILFIWILIASRMMHTGGSKRIEESAQAMNEVCGTDFDVSANRLTAKGIVFAIVLYHYGHLVGF